VRDSQSIIGFTEAELGFFIAILILIIAVKQTPEAQPKNSELRRPAIGFQLDEANRKVLVLEQQLADVRNQRTLDVATIAKLEKELDKLQRLRSPQLPTCTYKKVADGPILTVVIRGADVFQIGSLTYDLEDLREKADADLARGKAAGCRQVIRVSYAPSISEADAFAARKALQQDFYLQEVGLSKAE
jgi:hypothetical protein